MASLDFDLEESQFRSWYAAQAVALEDACAALTARVAAVVTQAGGVDTTKVEGRVKDVDECVRKFVRKYRPVLEESNTPYDIQAYITDLIGVRSGFWCHGILGGGGASAVHRLWTRGAAP